jgi:hypothetical protein
MRIYTYPALVNGSMSGNLTSNTFEMQNYWGAAASCIATGAPVGTLTILGSVDNINFTPLKNNGTNVTLAVTAAGTYIFDVTQTAVKFLQVTYTYTSGSGTLNITVYPKGY